MDDYYMTVKEFCERLQVSPSTVYRMIKNHMIPWTVLENTKKRI